MNRFLAAAAAFALVVTAPLHAASDDARAVLEQAIRAHGGAEAIGKHKAEILKAKGTVYKNGMQVPFTAETYVRLPDRFKQVMTLTVSGQQVAATVALDGATPTLLIDGQKQAVSEPMLAEMKETQHAEQVLTLVPLLNDSNCKLTALGNVTIRDRALRGVAVECKNHRRMELFFDKETGLLAMTRRTLLDGGKQVEQETDWSDYKAVDGVKRPFKFVVYQDGKKAAEGEVTQVELPGKTDEGFGLP